MVEATQPLKELNDHEQAALFHGRERRRSLAGIPELSRTHHLFGGAAMAIADLDEAMFPNKDTPVTFRTAIDITGATPTGLVFEIGDSTTGIALWLNDTTLELHAGAAGTVNGATAIFDNTISIPNGLSMELVAAVRPGDGRVRLWGNGAELARATASGGSFTSNLWAANSNGSFAAAAQGTTTAAITTAPSNFDVVLPLSVYMRQVPRHFV